MRLWFQLRFTIFTDFSQWVSQRGDKVRICLPPILLCVDDRRELLPLRKESLERLGYSVVTATSAAAAIAVLEQMAVAAVLVEYKLEGMDAEAVAHHIKQRFPCQPIILLSGYSEMRESILWLVDEYVMRSESVEGLARVIEQVIGNSRKLTLYPAGLARAHRRTA